MPYLCAGRQIAPSCVDANESLSAIGLHVEVAAASPAQEELQFCLTAAQQPRPHCSSVSHIKSGFRRGYPGTVLDPPLREPRIKISEPLSAFLEAKRIECQWAVAKRYMYTCNPLQTALFEARATLSIRYSRCPVQLYPLLALPRAGIYLSGTSFFNLRKSRVFFCIGSSASLE